MFIKRYVLVVMASIQIDYHFKWDDSLKAKRNAPMKLWHFEIDQQRDLRVKTITSN